MGKVKAISTTAEAELASFIAKFTPEIAVQVDAILARMRAKYPTAFELVYDNYNALAIGFGPTEKTSDAIFSIAVYPRWASLFFLQGAGLFDPDKILQGSGSVARHVVLTTPDLLDDPKVRRLMEEAVAIAKVPFAPDGERRLVIKSVSAKQRPRRPVIAAKRASARA